MISTASSVQYFGLKVTVIAPMETCALIRFQGQDLIVDTGGSHCLALIRFNSGVTADAFTEASARLRQMAACSRGF